MNTKIVFNGQEYNSVDEMPPEARQAYEQAMSVFADKNQNGTPDLFEGRALPGQILASVFADRDGNGTPDLLEGQGGLASRPQAIVYEGKVYTSLEELPAEARQKYEAGMGKLSAAIGKLGGTAANTDATMAWMESLAARQKAPPAAPQATPDPVISFSNDVVQPDTGNRRVVFLLALFVLVVLVGTVAFMLLR